MVIKMKLRVGKERVSRDGKSAKVIQYQSCEDFTIAFEDGQTRHMTHWGDFEKGQFNYQYMYHKVRTNLNLNT